MSLPINLIAARRACDASAEPSIPIRTSTRAAARDALDQRHRESPPFVPDRDPREREGKRTKDRAHEEPLEGTVSASSHDDSERKPGREPSREGDQKDIGR